MVEVYELEAKIKEEETKKIWDSIDEEFLEECEKHRQWYLDFTKKEHHPMSYQVNKEIEEWTQSAPLFEDMTEAGMTVAYLWFAYTCAWMSIGFYICWYILS
jgi:predicted anti-sigma-YlaC factor YlaD